MIVFDVNPDLGTDPLDEVGQPRREGVVIGPDQDAIVIWREWGDQFEGGSRTHVVGQGAWENVRLDTWEEVLRLAEDLP